MNRAPAETAETDPACAVELEESPPDRASAGCSARLTRWKCFGLGGEGSDVVAGQIRSVDAPPRKG